MPISDETPSRVLVIRRGRETYKVDEAKFDTVLIADGKTYKGLGFEPIAVAQDGIEIPYEKREHVDAVPGRRDVAAEQIAIIEAVADPPADPPAFLVAIVDPSKAEPAPRSARGSKETSTPS